MATTYGICPSCGKLNRVATESAAEKQPHCGHCKSQLNFHDGLSDVNAAQLASLIQSSPLPVVVDFWAPWCAPCVSFAPTYEKTASELAGRAVFVKLNTESHPDAAARHGVRGIPLLAVFNHGSEVKRQAGAMPPAMLRSWLEPTLS